MIPTVAGNARLLDTAVTMARTTSAELSDPYSASRLTPPGIYSSLTTANNEIREVNATTHVITTVAGTETFGYSWRQRPGDIGRTGRKSYPHRDRTQSGDLFISDGKGKSVSS